MGSPFEYVIIDKKTCFGHNPPSFDASNDRGALSTNVLMATVFCFLSVVQALLKRLFTQQIWQVEPVLDCKRTYLMVF